jgi:hypothetical protein
MGDNKITLNSTTSSIYSPVMFIFLSMMKFYEERNLKKRKAMQIRMHRAEKY